MGKKPKHVNDDKFEKKFEMLFPKAKADPVQQTIDVRVKPLSKKSQWRKIKVTFGGINNGEVHLKMKLHINSALHVKDPVGYDAAVHLKTVGSATDEEIISAVRNLVQGNLSA